MKKLTNTPHDKNFKVSLSNIEVAKEFLKIHLPRQVFKTIKANGQVKWQTGMQLRRFGI